VCVGGCLYVLLTVTTAAPVVSGACGACDDYGGHTYTFFLLFFGHFFFFLGIAFFTTGKLGEVKGELRGGFAFFCFSVNAIIWHHVDTIKCAAIVVWY